MVGAQFELERALAEIPVAARTEGTQQLQALKDMQGQIGRASTGMLTVMQADIVATVATARATVQQGRAAAIAAEVAIVLNEAAVASRATVNAVMADMHRFDRYLQFGPGDDETAYRQREADRLRDITAQQAKGTPQGDLNAAGGAIGQMVDAKAHGAGSSPEFEQRWNELVATTEKLRDAIGRNGGSTKEFDDRLRTDLRVILKAKGLLDAQIDARFAANPDPLEAAKDYVASEDDVQKVSQSVTSISDRTVAPATVVTTDDPPTALNMDDAMAEFRAAGIVKTEPQTDGQYAHGVAAKQRSAPTTGRPGIA